MVDQAMPGPPFFFAVAGLACLDLRKLNQLKIPIPEKRRAYATA
jgi:hypothetical protein